MNFHVASKSAFDGQNSISVLNVNPIHNSISSFEVPHSPLYDVDLKLNA